MSDTQPEVQKDQCVNGKTPDGKDCKSCTGGHDDVNCGKGGGFENGKDADGKNCNNGKSDEGKPCKVCQNGKDKDGQACVKAGVSDDQSRASASPLPICPSELSLARLVLILTLI